MAGLRNISSHMTLGNRAIGMTMSHFCIFLLDDVNGSIGRLIDNLKYDWLMMMSLGGAVGVLSTSIT